MSLINEALKKAQRSRSADQGNLAVPGGEVRIVKRGQPLSAKTILLYSSGGLVLFVLAVVGTVMLLNKPAAPTTVAVQKTPTPTPSTPEAGTPVIVPPVVMPPPRTAPPTITAATPSPAPEKSAAPPAPAPQPATDIAKQASRPVTPAPPPAPPTPNGPPDERVYQYLDSIRITAVIVRSADSRVMMNDRVYRLNEVVERNLNLRVFKVDAGQVTFVDGNGVEYVKYF